MRTFYLLAALSLSALDAGNSGTTGRDWCHATAYFQNHQGTYQFYNCAGNCPPHLPNCGPWRHTITVGSGTLNGFICTCHDPITGAYDAPSGNGCYAFVIGTTYPGTNGGTCIGECLWWFEACYPRPVGGVSQCDCWP